MPGGYLRVGAGGRRFCMQVSSEVGGVCGGLFEHVGLGVRGKRAVGTKKKPDVHRG